MSLARHCLWAGLRPVWPSLVVPCCAVLALRMVSEGSNITASHSHPQPGSTCKTNPSSSSHPNREQRTSLTSAPLFNWKITPDKTIRLPRIEKCNHVVRWFTEQGVLTQVHKTHLPNYRMYCNFVASKNAIASMCHVSDWANMCNYQLVLCIEISDVPQYDNKSTLVKLLESDLPANQSHALEQSVSYLTTFQENPKRHYKACQSWSP